MLDPPSNQSICSIDDGFYVVIQVKTSGMLGAKGLKRQCVLRCFHQRFVLELIGRYHDEKFFVSFCREGTERQRTCGHSGT